MGRNSGSIKHGSWWFLAGVLCAYLFLGISSPRKAAAALEFFARVLWQALPALILVFVLLFLADLLLGKQWINRNLGKESGTRGWLIAIFGGVVAAGPVYGWYALLAEMRQKGMREALVAAFLYSRALKLPLLPLMVHYFGIAYTAILSLCIMLFAPLTGLLLELLLGRHNGGTGIKPHTQAETPSRPVPPRDG